MNTTISFIKIVGALTCLLYLPTSFAQNISNIDENIASTKETIEVTTQSTTDNRHSVVIKNKHISAGIKWPF